MCCPQEGLTAALQDLADGCLLAEGRACAVKLLEALPTRPEAQQQLAAALAAGGPGALQGLLAGCAPPRLLYLMQVLYHWPQL